MNTIKRREFIKISGAAGAGLAAWPLSSPGAIPPSEKKARPNILVFLTDDHGQWAQHAYGNSELITPNMDQLAERGTRMTEAFTTCPVCSPARASFFTGKMPSQHGIHDWLMESWLNDETKPEFKHPCLEGQTLISEFLKKANYHTGLIGKWHCGSSRLPQPGFDRWFSYWDAQYPHLGAQQFSDQGKHIAEDGLQSPCLTKRAIDFLREHHQQPATKDEPFFLFVSYVDTHTPHKDAPPELVQQYAKATFHDIPDEPFYPCHGSARQPVKPNAENERERRMEYYGAVSSLDREVGKILAELDASGQMENTLIVYTSDHGLNGGHHGVWEKGNATMPQNFLEESVRVSCSISWPAGGIRQKAVCADLVNHCDLWATLLDIAGATPDKASAKKINSPGKSYLKQLRGETASGWRKTIISEYGNARMARTDRYKLIRRYPYAGITFPDELYDLKNDPRETKNVHDDLAFAEVVQKLSAEMHQFFADYTVPGCSGLDLIHQPKCTPASPWLVALKEAQTAK